MLLARGLVDVGRALDPENDALFTWWAPWRNMRAAQHRLAHRLRLPARPSPRAPPCLCIARGRHERPRTRRGRLRHRVYPDLHEQYDGTLIPDRASSLRPRRRPTPAALLVEERPDEPLPLAAGPVSGHAGIRTLLSAAVYADAHRDVRLSGRARGRAEHGARRSRITIA